MYGDLEETFFMVGQEKFHSFPLSKNLIEYTLTSEGFKMLDAGVRLISPEKNYPQGCDPAQIFFVSAVLQDD